MKQVISNVESAIDIIIESSQKHAIASNTGDYKTANKKFDYVRGAILYLRDHNGLNNLRGLLDHKDASVKVMAASYLLKHFERDAITVLEKIASQSLPIQSFDARMVLQEWRKGNLNL